MKCVSVLSRLLVLLEQRQRAFPARRCARAGGSWSHEVVVYEPADGWSRLNAIARRRRCKRCAKFRPLFPDVEHPGPTIVRSISTTRLMAPISCWFTSGTSRTWSQDRATPRAGGRFTLLFHDTHHRAVTAPHELARFDLDGYDGVLAFGEVLRQIYLKLGWASRAFTWHEAADTALYRPIAADHAAARSGLDRQLGRRGTQRRAAAISDRARSQRSRCDAIIYGVRYPADALEAIAAAGIRLWRLAAGASRARRPSPTRVSPSMCRAGPTPVRCRAFRPSACSKPWRAASRSYRRHGTTVEELFPAGTYLRVAQRRPR